MSHTVEKLAESRFLPNTGFAEGPESGLFQGNGDIFTSFWNEAQELTWSVGKTDVWDRRYFGDNKRVVTIEEIRQLAYQGDIYSLWKGHGLPGSAHVLGHAYDFPCPKPLGQILVRLEQLKGAPEYSAKLDMDEALLSIRAAKGACAATIQSFVAATRNIILIECAFPKSLPKGARFEIYRHRDTLERGKTVMELSGASKHLEYDYNQDPGNGPLDAPEAGQDGRFFWIRQRFPAEATFPQGFEYVMMATVAGLDCPVTLQANVRGAGAKVPLKQIAPEEWKELHGAFKEKRKAIEMVNAAPGVLASAELPPGVAAFTAYVSVMTTRDAPDPFSAARRELEGALAAGKDKILSEQREWWRAHYARSMLQTSDPAFDRTWYAALYGNGMTSRQGKLPLYNASAPLFTDATPWHGDYHFNEIWFWPILVANHALDLWPWLDLLEEMLPMAQNNAREVYGCRGCCYGLVHYPIKSKRIVYASQIWELGLELTAMALKVFWQYYQYTGDRQFLRARAYPMLREGARFYADYVRKGDDGYYHIIPTVSQENWGLEKDFKYNRDSVGALSQVRLHLLASAEAAGMLGLDAEERARWQAIATELAPYPTAMTEEGPIFVDVRDAPPSFDINTHADLAMVVWGDHVHLDGDPVLLEIARRTHQRMYHGRERNTRPHYSAAVERRLGLPRAAPYRDVEDLLMSCTGRIHLFIGVPEMSAARFERFLAVGGFEVSAEKKGGAVVWLQVKSLVGAICRIRNPWYPGPLRAIDLASGAEAPVESAGDTVSFSTVAGHAYELRR